MRRRRRARLDSTDVSRETSARPSQPKAWVPDDAGDTPIGAEAERAARVLHARRPIAAADAATRLHRRQPEGRRRQDDHRRQRRGSARAAGTEGPRDRPRPAGQRQHRARHRAPPGHAVVLRGTHRRDVRAGGAATQPAQRASLLRARDHRPRRRRDRVGQHGRARGPIAQRADQPRRTTTSTTSSSTARRRSACSRSMHSSRRRK